MSFTVKSRGCAALSQPATRPSSRTRASLGCEAIARRGRAHAVALGVRRRAESSPRDSKTQSEEMVWTEQPHRAQTSGCQRCLSSPGKAVKGRPSVSPGDVIYVLIT